MDSKLSALSNRFGTLNSKFLAQPLESLLPMEPLCVKESVLVFDAVRLMQENPIGCLLVTDKEGKLSGIFSKGDVITRVVFSERALDDVPLSELMTDSPHAESMDTTIAFALKIMSQRGFEHIPITDSEHRPVGLVSAKDILDFIENELINSVLDSEIKTCP
jgi:CBS domain-containing protein